MATVNMDPQFSCYMIVFLVGIIIGIIIGGGIGRPPMIFH